MGDIFSPRSGPPLLLFRLWALWATRSVVHKSTDARRQGAQAIPAMDDDAEKDWSIRDEPGAVVVFDEADRLAGQRAADVDRGALPADFAVMAHAPDRMLGVVVRLAQDAVEAARRDGVMFGRRFVAKRFVRPLFVVEALKATQSLELFAQRPGRRRHAGRSPSTRHSAGKLRARSYPLMRRYGGSSAHMGRFVSRAEDKDRVLAGHPFVRPKRPSLRPDLRPSGAPRASVVKAGRQAAAEGGAKRP